MLNRILEIGDKVYCVLTKEYGTVIELDIGDTHPYLIEFKSNIHWYGEDGHDVNDRLNYIILTHD